MKKIIFTILGLLLIMVISGAVVYNNSLSPAGTSKDVVTFEVKSGMTSKEILSELHKDGLIKNEFVSYLYVKHNNINNLQAGTYNLNKGMGLKEIVEIISKGETIDNSISLTFIEGKRVKKFAEVISKEYEYTEDEILNKWKDKEYLNKLINKYWFLTEDILNENLYYPLEGYLYPDTYRFEKDATVEQITEKLLDTMGNYLEEYRNGIDDNKYVNSIHKVLTMASIVELEGAKSDDRAGIAGVFFNRLQNGWNLGSDVTTYYAAQIDFTDRDLTQAELDDVNAYNTRSSAMAGKLPVGPICNPNIESIKAVINPKQNDYYFFVADKNGKTYFSKTNGEHETIISDLKNKGLWYTYS